MTEQELKNLSRRDLLEMLIEQSKEVQDLKSKLAYAESLLADKTAMIAQMEQMNKTAAELDRALAILESNSGEYKNIGSKKPIQTKNKVQDNPDTKRLQQEIIRINIEKARMKELRELKNKQNKPNNPTEQQNESKNELDLKVDNYGDDGRKEDAGT